MRNLKIFDVGNTFGTMNHSTIKLSNITSEDRRMISKIHGLDDLDDNYVFTNGDKKIIFMNHRIALGKEYGFEPSKMFMMDQLDKSGTYHVFDKEYVDANPKGWSDIREDIGIITKDNPGIVVCHPVADCPVIIMKDEKNGVSAVAHCSAELIDKRLPMLIADALLDYSHTKDEDISVYVSSMAGAGWTYIGMPSWISDAKLWFDTGAITFDSDSVFIKGKYVPKIHINLKKALIKQLRQRNISLKNVHFSDVDTITNPNYYSNAASSTSGLNDPQKFGRNLVGAFYEGEEKPKVMCK